MSTRKVVIPGVLLLLAFATPTFASGSISCWGALTTGVDLSSGFTQISAGGYHNLALKADGSIVAWGYNDYGRCNVASPKENFRAIAVGEFHSLGLNNIGLLVSVIGKVTHSDTGFFYLDDGSNLDDGSGYRGVRVLASGLSVPAPGSFARVIGISSCCKPDTSLRRQVIAAEIVLL